MSRRPDVFLFVVDSLREDAVDYKPGMDCRTPNFAALAERSIVFDTAITHGVGTAPAMTALLTGSLPLSHGGHWWLADDRWTIAEVLTGAGYKTGAIHTNPNVSRLRNFHQGFDTFDEHLLPIVPGSTLEYAPDGLIHTLNKAVRLVRRTPYLPASALRKKILRWINGTNSPRFLWTQFMDVHGPYLSHEGLGMHDKIQAERLWRTATTNPDSVTDEQHRELERRYGAEVAYWDGELGRLLNGLESHGVLEEALVIVTSDHGDEFREHGKYGHGNNAYEELVRVPLIVNLPGNIHAGTHISRPVELLNVVPTIVDVTGTEPPADAAEQFVGESLLNVVDSNDEGRDGSFETIIEKQVRGADDFRIAVRTERWKFIDDRYEGYEELYDLTTDKNELKNVSVDHHAIVREMQSKTAARFNIATGVTDYSAAESTEVRTRLKQLGYTDE